MMNCDNRISVLVGTCDKYSPLWENFQVCFDRTWKMKTRNLFVGETLTVSNYTKTEFKTILCKEADWGSRMLRGINSCDTDYIFFILEDYFFHYQYPIHKMNEYISDMDTYSINRLQISPSNFQTYAEQENINYRKFTKSSHYQISMQPSIWRKDYLLKVLLPNYSPWDFESKGSRMCIMDQNDHKIYVDRSIPEVYFNAVRSGFKKSPGWEKFMKEKQLNDFKDSTEI
jgi:hypothetical protein